MAIARKVAVSTSDEGLVLQPLGLKGQRSSQPLLVKYGEASIFPVPRDSVPDPLPPASSMETFGIIGLMSVLSQSFLITITRREQVAQIRGFAVYVVTGVAITPCSSQTEAEAAIAKTARHLKNEPADALEDDTDTQEDDGEALPRASEDVDEVDDVIDDSSVEAESSVSEPVTSTVAEDVIRRRGSFGRFAQRWFSKKGWVLNQRQSMGLSRPALEPVPPATPPPGTKPTRSSEDSLEAIASTFLPKLLHTTQIFFGSSRSFFFSYDFDITRRWGECGPFSSDVPLYAQVEPTYFWNNHLLQPFLSVGAESVALPVMQGFVGQRPFMMDRDPPQVDDSEPDAMEMSSFLSGGSGPTSPPAEEIKDAAERRASEQDLLITLISRRSIKRAGLRYMRRGIDEDGNAANTVETEQIMSTPWWNSSSPNGSKTYSFVQTRGSIPVFFTQSPYSFKPVPALHHSPEANLAAMQKHFDLLHQSYGSIHLVNLVEKNNTEAVVGDAYSKYVAEANEGRAEHEKIAFEWFDFHDICRGMKFENVSKLLEKIRGDLDRFGNTVEADGKVLKHQSGVFRTNCMDCLDRTNVCQSMFARYMLEAQLREEGFDMSAQVDQNDVWFNTIWADNGDAVSNQYASTAAMKGDFTRTRKRDYRGTLNDLGLSLTRFYNGIVNDYFSQMAIDFLLGNVTALVFSEFESNLITRDPGVSILKKREQAIQLCQSRVIADASEEFTAGWVVLTPQVSGTISGQPLEEAVFLLTDCAMYLCRFNWDLDRVSSFERVELAHVVGIKMGTYVTSTISSVQMDEVKNVGLVLSYQPGKDDFTRTNTRTLSSLADKRKTHRTTPAVSSGSGPFASFFSGRSQPGGLPPKRIALKMPYARSSLAKDGDEPRQTELQLVQTISSEIQRLVGKAQEKEEDVGWGIIEKQDIISLEEAKKSTGIFEQLGHSLKRMVWA